MPTQRLEAGMLLQLLQLLQWELLLTLALLLLLLLLQWELLLLLLLQLLTVGERGPSRGEQNG